MDLPVRHVRIAVRRWMLLDVVRRRISRRIAGHQRIVFVLIDSQVVDLHGCWHQRSEARQVQCGKAIRHAEVDHDSHGLFGHHPLADIAIRAHCARIQCPGRLVPNIPRHLSRGPWYIVEAVLLELLLATFIPLIVEVRHSGNGLLVYTSAI